MMYEQRKSVRRRTLLEGRIEVEKLNGRAVDCAIRNVSDAGARIALHGRPIVPQRFHIGISGSAAKAARLVWYRDGHAGVAFFDAPSGHRQGWDGVCRRAPRSPASSAPAEAAALQARIEAIAAGRRTHDRRRRAL